MPLIDLTEQELADAIDLCENPAGHLPASDPISVAAKLLAKLRNSQAQVWEPVESTHIVAYQDDLDMSLTICQWDGRTFVGIAERGRAEWVASLGFDGEYRLCRLVEQERSQ